MGTRLGGPSGEGPVTSRAECLDNAERCNTLAKLQRDPTIKAGLEEAARQWFHRAKLLEQIAASQATAVEALGADHVA
jgi:hypothetical protein